MSDMRGNIDYNQVRLVARQGNGLKFQMYGGDQGSPAVGPTNGHVAIYDANGNVIDGGAAPASAITLQTNGSANASQTLLNLKAGSNVTLTNSGGDVTIASSGGGSSNFMTPAISSYPVAGNFSWQNQGGASVSGGSSNPMLLTVPASAADNLRIQEEALPARPFNVVAGLDVMLGLANFSWGGLIIRDSGTGKLVSFSYTYQNGVQLIYDKWNSVTSYNSGTAIWNFAGAPFAPRILKINDNNTNFTLYGSFDKINFFQLFQISRTDFLTTPDHIGWFGNSRNSTAVYVNLWLWE